MTDSTQQPSTRHAIADQPAASRRDIVTGAAAIAALAGAAGTAEAQGVAPANVQFINPPTMAKPPGYTHVIEVTGPGRTVYIAGQLGLDPSGKLAGEPGDFRAQATQAFENLKNALAAVGGTFDHVVKLNNYLVDITAHIPILREVRDRYVNKATPPASTTVQVGKLARDGLLFEVEAVAVLPPK
jgi:enamine deaminase RidA (YjgF/YER057c/UK114 family)